MTGRPSRPGRSRHGAIRTPAVVFGLMFAINALNYLDRLLVVAVGPTLKADFHLRDRDIGLLASAFVLIYTLAALPLGLIADRVSRARVVALGVAVWSLASIGTGLARGFAGLFAMRAGVGIGEASYYPAGTALLSAYFPLEQRARVMSRWQAGQLVGGALAFALSGVLLVTLGPSLGWRVAFLITGPPGLLLAYLMWRVADNPPHAPGESSAYARKPPALTEATASATAGATAGDQAREALGRIRAVLSIRTVWLVIVLQAAINITATPAITFLPIYMRSPNGPFRLGMGQTNAVIGIVVVAGGVGGAILGGYLADWLGRRVRGGRLLAAGVGFGLALPCYAVMLLSASLPLFVIAGTAAILALYIPAGPLTASLQDATPRALRATAVAVTLLLSHLLGDAWSPRVVGGISSAMHERSGTALLIVGLPTLAVATLVGVLGVTLYAREVAPERPPA
jgi:MFS transporter, Spinster family, sphingosine-1-phosphate transporter